METVMPGLDPGIQSETSRLDYRVKPGNDAKLRGANNVKQMWVYILANKQNGTIYTGMTNDLIRRVHEHRTHAVPGFTEKYDVTRLVWFEGLEDAEQAIKREKAIKSWSRKWKLELIEKMNPEWSDLWDDIAQP